MSSHEFRPEAGRHGARMSSLVLEEDVKTQMCFTSQDKWLELCNDCNEVVLPAICSSSLFPFTD